MRYIWAREIGISKVHMDSRHIREIGISKKSHAYDSRQTREMGISEKNHAYESRHKMHIY